MSPRQKRWLYGVAIVLVVGVTFVWALPQILKLQALELVPALTGRAVEIGDIDLNMFTGRLAVKKLRIAEADPAQTFLSLERLDIRVVPWSMALGHIRVAELVITEPTVNLVRVGPTEFNFSDVLGRLAAAAGPPAPAPPEPKPKSRWTAGLERFALIRLNVTGVDRAVKPTSEWRVRDLSIEAGNLTTKPGPLGSLDVHGALNDSPIEFSAKDIDLTPTSFRGTFSIQNFNLVQIRPYLPPTLPAALETGIAGVTMTVKLELGPGPGGLAVGLVTGDVALTSLALAQPGKATPFLVVPSIAVGLKEVNLVSRVVTVSSVAIEGLDLKAVRDKQEDIDLLALTKKPEASSTAPPAPPTKAPAAAPAPARPEPELKLTVEKVTLKGAATFTDESISSPPTVLKLDDLAVQLDDVTWPNVRPIKLAVTTKLPGGGRYGTKGTVRLEPLDVSLRNTARDAPIEPYRAYFPFPSRFGGRLNADSQDRIRIVNGKLTLLSRGNSWATNLTVTGPDAKEPSMRMERMEITGIDFDWPRHARVARVRLKAPSAEVDRAADGSINVQKFFTPNPVGVSDPVGISDPVGSPSAAPPKAPAGPPAASGPPAADKKPPGLIETMELHFKEIVLEDGYARFLDHTTQPPFSQDITKLAVSVKGLSNKKTQRASVLMRAVIGGDSTLDVRAQLSAIGAPTYVDTGVELKKLALPSANPYVDQALAWIIRRGELTAKVDAKIDNDKLDVQNDILVGNLRVAPSRPSDEVKKRIGLPLGLIVALIKDGNGNIHVKVPITGTLSDRQFDLSDAIWTAVRNVVVNILKAPFRAIGGLFTSGDKIDELRVDPLVFAAGNDQLGPELERQTVRVADFLRRAPYVGLTMASVTTDADVEALKARAVAERLEKFQAEQGITDQAAALRRYFQVIVRDAQLPMKVEDQLLLLRRREPEPTERLAALRQRRLDVTRERLAKVEGIPEARLQVAPEGPPSAVGASPPTGAPPPAGTPPAAGAPAAGAPPVASAPPAAGAAPDTGAPPAAAPSPAQGGRVEFGITGESD